MAQEEAKVVEGNIVEVLPDTMFRVMLDKRDMVTAHISGRLRKNYMRILTGDRVLVEVTPCDTTRGRITARLRE